MSGLLLAVMIIPIVASTTRDLIRQGRRYPRRAPPRRACRSGNVRAGSNMTTIAATIVSQLDSALTDSTKLAVKTLAEAGLVLMVITLLTNVAARTLVRRTCTTALPVGRGV